MKKTLKIILWSVLGAIILVFCYFFVGPAPQKNITWGVDFSQMEAEQLGLNWQQLYLAMLTDLKVKNIKIHTQWDFVQGNKNDPLYFNDIDWQLAEAKQYGASIIYVLGMKTGRWPECHDPQWADALS